MKHPSSVELAQSQQELGEAQPAEPTCKTPALLWRGAVAAVTRWIVAAKFFILLIVRKDGRTPHAMRFLLATEGKTFERSFFAFRATPAGRDLLRRQPTFRSLCSDRGMLAACPPASLGYWYSEFMRAHDLDAEHYLGMAIDNGERFAGDAERAWYHIRVDASHDVRHVLSGYGPDVLGEICLLSFRFGQIRHPGIFALVVLGF